MQWANLSKIICINDSNLATNTTWLLFITCLLLLMCCDKYVIV